MQLSSYCPALVLAFLSPAVFAQNCQDVSTSFEFTNTSGNFTLGTPPKTVTLDVGLSQTVGIPALYNSGFRSWMVDAGQTGRITFDTPAEQVDTFLRNQFALTSSVLTVFGTDGSVLATFNGTNSGFLPISVASTSPPIGSMTLQNTGQFGWTVLDDLDYCAFDSPYEDYCNGDGGDQLGCTDCPCNNNAPIGTIGGCINGEGRSSRLFASGTASASNDTLRFEATGLESTTFMLLTSAAAQAPAAATNPCFGANSGLMTPAFDGLRCVVQDFQRHGSRSGDANGDIGTGLPGPGGNGWGGTSNPAAGLIATYGFVSGQTRYFQGIYRTEETTGCMRHLNTSQGIAVTFEP